jgi:hypothetical protein
LWEGTKNALFEEDFDYFLYQMENDPVAQEMKDYGWSSRAVLKNPLDFEEFYLSQVPMKLADLGADPNLKIRKLPIGKLLNTPIGKKAIYAPKKLGQGFKTSERLFELQGDMQGYYVYNKWRKELDAMAKADPKFDVDRAKRHLIRIINAGTGRGNFNMVERVGQSNNS